MISTYIQQLVNYGLDTGLIQPDDEIYIRNQLLMTMGLDSLSRRATATTSTSRASSPPWWTMRWPAASARTTRWPATCSTPS